MAVSAARLAPTNPTACRKIHTVREASGSKADKRAARALLRTLKSPLMTRTFAFGCSRLDCSQIVAKPATFCERWRIFGDELAAAGT